MNKIKLIPIYFRTLAVLIITTLVVACGSGGGDRSGLTSTVYSISGTVSGDIKAGVTLTLIGSTATPVTTNTDGNYSFTNLANGSYTVAPSLTNYTFSPSSPTVVVAGNNISSINFTATVNATPSYSLSGTVSGGIKQNVLITLSGSGSATTSSDVNGFYGFSGLVAASYTVTPSKLGYSFSPAPPTVVISTANISGKDFVSTGMLNDTGITSTQCYQAASDVLVACTAAGATSLNGAQDGMVGRDVTVTDPAPSDGKLGFSFTKVCNNGQLGGSSTCSTNAVLGSNPTDWGCTQDNVTGLMWEVKTIVNMGMTYTNYDSTTALQISSITAPTQAQIDAATNSIGFKNSVNTAVLCGHNDWRLPSAKELQSIVNYGVAFPVPTVDATWFPNTTGAVFWSSSPDVVDANYAWFVNFGDGSDNSDLRNGSFNVRLVSAGQ